MNPGINPVWYYLHNFFFNVYPYICLAVFFMGSLARFDRDQYTWKSDSSQLLRTGTLRWGSNLFHVGILFLFFGHFVGLLTPHWFYEGFISAEAKQRMAIYSGGIAGAVCFVGLSLLLHRRIFDPRIRLTSHRTDLAILIILWVQLVIGLITLPFSYRHTGRQRDADSGQLGAGHRHFPARRTRPAGAGLAVSAAPDPGYDDLPVVPVQPTGACVERFCQRGLLVPALPAGAQPPAERAARPERPAPAHVRLNTGRRSLQ